MEVVQFIADDAASALAQIHERLGPEAVVLSVRRLPAHGVARLWQKSSRIEVLARLPSSHEANSDSPVPAPRQVGGADLPVGADAQRRGPVASGIWSGEAPIHVARAGASGSRWHSVRWLEAQGLLPPYAEQLQARLNARHPSAPASLDAEWQAVRDELARFWPADETPAAAGLGETHVFIGPPGSGKTTVLCKWLTLAVLTQGRSAGVWRLDSHVANTAEFLAVHCEMLGVPLERFWTNDLRITNDDLRAPQPSADPVEIESRKSQIADFLRFVDLPGVEGEDPQALAGLRSQLASLAGARVHLVLNAAYETDLLLSQWRAFAGCGPEDLIFTHLDEEGRRAKLWNFVFGTNCRIGFLSAGQKIPGLFQRAVPERLFSSKSAR